MVRYIIYIKKGKEKEKIYFGSDNYKIVTEEYINLHNKILKNKIHIEISLYDFNKNLYLKVNRNYGTNK